MIQMDGGDRLRVTLLDQMSVVESSRSSLPGLTLDAVLRAEKRAPTRPSPARSHSNRTLLDIMREEHRRGHNRDKTTWRAFRDKLRLKRAGAAWTSPDFPIHNSDISIQNSDIPIPNRDIHRFNRLGFLLSNSAESTPEATQSELIHHHNYSANVSIPVVIPPSRSLPPQISRQNPHPAHSEDEDGNEPVAREGRIPLGVALAEERALSAREAEEASTAVAAVRPPEEVQPARMSLMDLLEETDRQLALLGPTYTMEDVSDDREEEEEDDDVVVDSGGAAAAFGCCVCMTRNKGAAFIPCGHTFCRVCSRELWVQRGNCPLCNTCILEILDIF